MFEILYASTATAQIDPFALDALLGTSRDHNARLQVTGSLLHIQDERESPGFFVQVLEGPQDAVEATYTRVQCDGRHTDVTTLHERTSQGRAFRDWSMRLESVTPAQAREAIARTGRPADPDADLAELIRQPSCARGLIAAFRTVTPRVSA